MRRAPAIRNLQAADLGTDWTAATDGDDCYVDSNSGLDIHNVNQFGHKVLYLSGQNLGHSPMHSTDTGTFNVRTCDWNTGGCDMTNPDSFISRSGFLPPVRVRADRDSVPGQAGRSAPGFPTLFAMSYDIFVRRLGGGPLPTGLFEEVLLPFADHHEPEHHFWHLRTPDDGEADISATMNREAAPTALTINHFSTGAVLDLVVEFARRADAIILLPGCPTALTSPAQRERLPPDLGECVLVHDGADIAAMLAAG